jgi:nucleoid-associated protein EbfC
MSFGPGGMAGLFGGFQQKMDAMKEELARTEVEGQAGGGKVKVVATGGLEINRVIISPELAGDPEMIEDLIVVATNDALRRARGLMETQMQGLLGGLPLPPGLLGF